MDNRYEFGRVEDRNGWLVSIYQLRNQGQEFDHVSGDVVFNDPPTGPSGTHLLQGPIPLDPATWAVGNPVVTRDLPVTFYNIALVNSTDTWGVEVDVSAPAAHVSRGRNVRVLRRSALLGVQRPIHRGHG